MTTEPDGVDGTTSDGRCKNNQCDQRSHGTAFVDVKAFSLCGGSRATEKAACLACACGVFSIGLTPWLTGAGSRRLEGTNIGHENAEGMVYVGVRIEPPVGWGAQWKVRAVGDLTKLPKIAAKPFMKCALLGEQFVH